MAVAVHSAARDQSFFRASRVVRLLQAGADGVLCCAVLVKHCLLVCSQLYQPWPVLGALSAVLKRMQGAEASDVRQSVDMPPNTNICSLSTTPSQM
jgi:hypothetical protein